MFRSVSCGAEVVLAGHVIIPAQAEARTPPAHFRGRVRGEISPFLSFPRSFPHGFPWPSAPGREGQSPGPGPGGRGAGFSGFESRLGAGRTLSACPADPGGCENTTSHAPPRDVRGSDSPSRAGALGPGPDSALVGVSSVPRLCGVLPWSSD